MRAKRSKYPAINGGTIVNDNNGNHLIADDNKCPRNPIQSESNPIKPIFILPEWINQVTWDDFILMRKTKRNPPTDRAKRDLVRDLEILKAKGEDIDLVIAQSIKHGWLTFYEVKDTTKKEPAKNSSGWGAV